MINSFAKSYVVSTQLDIRLTWKVLGYWHSSQLQSQPFFRSYQSNLPTSLTHVLGWGHRFLTLETWCGYGYDHIFPNYMWHQLTHTNSDSSEKFTWGITFVWWICGQFLIQHASAIGLVSIKDISMMRDNPTKRIAISALYSNFTVQHHSIDYGQAWTITEVICLIDVTVI